MKKMNKWLAAMLIAVLALSLTACGAKPEEKPAETSAAASSEEEAAEEEAVEEEAAEEAASAASSAEEAVEETEEAAGENPVAGKRVAYVMLLPSASIFQMWSDSCAQLCDALDVQYDFFFCDGDFNKWQDTIRTCASAGYDGLLLSHGNQDGSYVFLKEITEQYPDMKIVAFDTQFYTDGEFQKIDGVTQMFQQDESLVTVLIESMIAAKEERGEEGPVRLIKVWRGPNFNSPFTRRQVGWQKYLDEGKIEEVGEIQPLEDSVASANSVAAAYLQSISRDDVDGIIAYYDLYGQGVYNAILENDNYNGTNGDPLPMASVDIDPVDITNMQTTPEIWTAAGTTDWTMNGEIGMRALLLEIAGEYDKIYDPASDQSGVDVIEVPGTAILASSLTADSTVENLGDIAGETYGNLDYLSEADWMPKDLIH